MPQNCWNELISVKVLRKYLELYVFAGIIIYTLMTHKMHLACTSAMNLLIIYSTTYTMSALGSLVYKQIYYI